MYNKIVGAHEYEFRLKRALLDILHSVNRSENAGLK